MKKTYIFLTLTICLIGATSYYFLYNKKKLETLIHVMNDYRYSPSKKDLMLGSSSILRMNPLTYLSCGNWLNRGINSAIIPDMITYINYSSDFIKPPTVLIYAGENDIAYGEPLNNTIINYKKLLKLILIYFPETEIHILAIKPSPSRTLYFNDFNNLNKKIKSFSLDYKNIYFHKENWDINNSSQKQTLFLTDQVHLSAHGYRRFTKGFNTTCKN